MKQQAQQFISLIDGDEITYKAAHASQDVFYNVYHDDKFIISFPYKREADLFTKDDPEFRYEKVIEPKEERFAYLNLRTLIKEICKENSTDQYSIYLSGKGNYRYPIATIVPYKGNRENLERPFYYHHLRKYLEEEEYAIVTTDQEADDALGIMQNYYLESGKFDPILVSQDKDLRMIEGYYYEQKSKERKYISRAQADLWFFIQLLVGDSTDNIPGIYRVGITTAERILLPYIGNCQALYNEVVNQYTRAKLKGNLRFETSKSIEEIILEIGQLLWIRRKPEQLWTPELLLQ